MSVIQQEDRQENPALHFAPLQPPRRILFGPGPSMVHPRVYEALAQPIVGHLDPYFIQVMGDIQHLLKAAFGTSDAATLVISGTGSAGMEAAISNFLEPGDKFAVFANGYFSDRLTEMAKRHGAAVVRLEKPWGETFTDEEAREFIRREKPKVVAYVHAETSTGALQSGHAICAAAHDAGAIVIADCVTSLGGVPVQFDETGIDVAYSCTQKGLSCPPGLSPMALSPRAIDAARAHYSIAQLVSRPQADSRLLYAVAPLSSHCADFHVLRLARGAAGDRRGRHREPLGAPSPLSPVFCPGHRSDGPAHARSGGASHRDPEHGVRAERR
jgi:alanine-glyoxylate transaminase/serine-glyoxylate transaminase/serine-pyruvate transaminase